MTVLLTNKRKKNATTTQVMQLKELAKRLIVAGIAIPTVCFCIVYPIYMNIITTTLAYVGVQEWVLLRIAMLNHLEKKPDREVPLPERPKTTDELLQVHSRAVLSAALPLLAYFFFDRLQYFVAALLLIYAVMFTLTIFGFMHSSVHSLPPAKKTVYDMIALGVDYFGIIYVAVQISCAILILRTTPILLFTILFANWAADAAAMFAGKNFGRNKLCPSLSPNKTVEGAVGAVIGAVLLSLAVRVIAQQLGALGSRLPSTNTFIYNGILLGTLGIIGDLLESYYKRVAFVKDSGSFFGAHGGVLDRIDGLLFSFPIMYVVDQLGYFSV